MRPAHPQRTTKPVPFGAGFFYGRGGMIGLEALERWRHPERGLVVPGKFIPVAHANGMIIPLNH
ncbi:MAG: hypothetical protein L6277_17720 [Desulfobacterales bacterium]|nr:hypothetical protein [Desulfobacterales bacterium]